MDRLASGKHSSLLDPMLSYKESEVLLIPLQASFSRSVGAATLNISLHSVLNLLSTEYSVLISTSLSIMTLSIMTFITMALSILGLFVTPNINDTA